MHRSVVPFCGFPSRRRWWLLSALLVLTASRAFADDKIRIEVPIFEGGFGLSFYVECAREYEKVRPDVSVDLYGDPRIADKLRVRILEGTYPEIVHASLNYWILIRNGDVLPMDEFLDGPNWEGDASWRDSFLPGTLDRYVYRGKVYGIPFAYSLFVIWYNKNMFARYGWKPPRTWDEFFALCEKIKAKGIAPLAFQGRYPSYAQAVVDSAYYHLAGPKRYLEQQELVPGCYDNVENVTALSLVQKTALNYFQTGAMGMSHTESQMEFLLGNAAMIYCGSWLKSEMMGKIPEGFRFGAFNLVLPSRGSENPTAVYSGSSYFFVMSKSKHAREAVDFLRFMTSRAQAGKFARQRDVPVAVKGANEGNLTEDLADLVEIINAARTSYGKAPGEGYPEMSQPKNDALYDLLTGRKTPEETAKRLEEAARVVRGRAEHPDVVIVRHVWKPALLLGLLGAAMVYWLVTTALRIRAARRAGKVRMTAGRHTFGPVNILLFVGPAFVLYTVFVIVPCVKSFTWSVHRWDGLTSMTFKGLLHFRRLLFESDGFWIALRNNLFLMLVIPAFILPLSLFLAACISRGVRGSTVFRIVFFFPNILGGVAAAILWMHMYNPQGGVVNGALVAVGRGLSAVGLTAVGAWFEGFKGFAWLSQDHLYWALIPMAIWGGCGFNMLLFLAAMEGIPQSLYEAAELDGASQWKQFRHITFPLIWEVFSIAMVFMIIGGMKAFERIWLLTNQLPATSTHVIGTRMVYTMFTEFKVGEATAIAVLLFLMVFFGTTATLRLMRRETVEY